MPRIRTLLLCFLLAACGGSAGFQQAAPRAQDASHEVQINDNQVERAFALRAQLPKPYRVGVLFREAPETDEGDGWRWEPEHRAQVIGALEALEGKGEIGAVFAIAQSTIVADNLNAIRVAAARQGADAVLVVSGKDRARREANAWALSYLAVVPMLFAPGNELRVDFATHAELWDVRNEYLYLAAEAEARAEQQRALPYIDEEEASGAAQKESLGLLVKELTKRFGRLHGEAG